MSGNNINAGETKGDVDTQTGGQNGGAREGVREIDLLKSRARMMGIDFSNNIGVEALKKKIEDKLAGVSEGEEIKVDSLDPEMNVNVGALNALSVGANGGQVPDRPKTLREWIHDENMRLVRLRITNLDPKKKDLPGEVITVANEYLGTVRKFVPFGEHTENGYHVPYCIYEFLRSRRFLNIRVTKRNGQEHVSQTWAPEFSLEVLDPLTTAELRDLAQAQIAAGSIAPNEA